MSSRAKAYIGLIITLGVAAVIRGLLRWEPNNLERFAWYLALSLPAACLKVRLPGVSGTMSVFFVFVLAGVVELGLAETLVIGACCVLVQSFWRAKVRPRTIQIVFGIASISIAITAADFFYRLPFEGIFQLQAPLRLALAATVFFIANTLPVAAVIALTENKSLRQVWRDYYWWSFAFYLVGAAIVGMFGFANRLLDWQAWLLIVPVIYAIYRSYHLSLERLEAQKMQAEAQRSHAEEVAGLLAESMAANANLEAVIQASPLAIFALDRLGNVKNWNAAAERMFGWTAREVLGHPLPCCGDLAAETIRAIVDRTLRGEILSGIELTQWRKDGASFEAAIWTAPLRESGNEMTGILLTIADVSDRKRLEEQLRVSQKMEAIGRLAGGVAHDFNNLLTIINGYSTMLLKELRPNPYALNKVQEILKAGNRASDLVAQLLTFSRRQMIKPAPLDLNRFVRDMERMLSRLIGEHIEFRTVLDENAGFILADHSQMTQVLMNLVTNARDAMPNGGALTIETARVQVSSDSEPHLELEPGDYVRLMVKDTGYGMDRLTQERIFEPFFTTKEQGSGTGLGLCSVYGGVQQNRGRIFVDTELGKGTTFSVYLPSYEVPAAETEVIRSDNPSSGSETILLVEDETALRHMLHEALAKAGYRVWEAGNGAEGLEQWAASRGRIDLLVSDVLMPVMNGLTLARELTSRAPALSVIFMSGHADDVITNQGVLGPGIDLLPKPFLPDVLVQKVREVLDQKRIALLPR